MMRQLGAPNAFRTTSANDVRWPNLLSILHRLKKQAEYKDTRKLLSEIELYPHISGQNCQRRNIL